MECAFWESIVAQKIRRQDWQVREAPAGACVQLFVCATEGENVWPRMNAVVPALPARARMQRTTTMRQERTM
jgi:hypothetical protein